MRHTPSPICASFNEAHSFSRTLAGPQVHEGLWPRSAFKSAIQNNCEWYRYMACEESVSVAEDTARPNHQLRVVMSKRPIGAARFRQQHI